MAWIIHKETYNGMRALPGVLIFIQKAINGAMACRGHENLLQALYDQFLNPLLTDQGEFWMERVL